MSNKRSWLKMRDKIEAAGKAADTPENRKRAKALLEKTPDLMHLSANQAFQWICSTNPKNAYKRLALAMFCDEAFWDHQRKEAHVRWAAALVENERHKKRAAEERAIEPLFREYESLLPSAFDSVNSRLLAAGYTLSHTSDSGSRYYKKNEHCIRLSDHFLPDHAEREYNHSMGWKSFDDEVVLDFDWGTLWRAERSLNRLKNMEDIELPLIAGNLE